MTGADENPTYEMIEIVGTSTESVSAAIASGLERASRTLRRFDWFEVTEVRGRIDEHRIGEFQVGLKVGVRLED